MMLLKEIHLGLCCILHNFLRRRCSKLNFVFTKTENGFELAKKEGKILLISSQRNKYATVCTNNSKMPSW
jgi:hypothetical protein